MSMSEPSNNTNAVVGYTVKELLTRLEGKLDAYTSQQGELVSSVHDLIPKVEIQNSKLDEHSKKIEKLELIQLGRDAVRAWHGTAIRLLYGVVGSGASFAIAYGVFHH